jgi:hypothetical protein
MRVDKLRRRQRHPLIERHFGEVVAFEDFEKVEDAALAIPRDRSTFLVFYGAGSRDAINAVLAAASVCSTPAPRSNSRAKQSDRRSIEGSQRYRARMGSYHGRSA